MTPLKLTFTLGTVALLAMGATCQESLRANLVKTCGGLDQAYLHYDAIVAEGAVSANAQRKVAFARRQTDRLCASPETATTVSIAAVAAGAYVALQAAFREGGELRSAKVGYSQVENLRSALEKARR